MIKKKIHIKLLSVKKVHKNNNFYGMSANGSISEKIY